MARTWAWVLIAASVVICAACAQTSVHIQGTVHIRVCGGTEPANPPPGYQNCTQDIVRGGPVILYTEQGAFAYGTNTDSQGRYTLDAQPGTYILVARSMPPIVFYSAPKRLTVFANQPLTVDIQVDANLS